MKLLRIELVGFKSFRTKTGLEIGDGVTTIVGPNGCGKSNIVDAIKWCIGAQSAKDLRGKGMDELIFAGSENHRAMGMAEVSLTMQNDRGDVPAAFRDHAEIKVTRRLYRDGDSEYELNGSKVRLRDVQELFLGTGVGSREAYSIIEQGRIGFIVSARPEERRLIIEEAAGITRYKYQRKAAERRLEKTRENLLRVADVLGEVGRQIGSLERQAKRAAKWKELTQRRRSLEVTTAVERYEKVATALAELRKRFSGLRELYENAAVEHHVRDAKLLEGRSRLASQERELSEATESSIKARARAELLRSQLGFAERALVELGERAAQVVAQQQEQTGVAEVAEAAIAALVATLEEARSSAGSVAARLAALAEQVERARAQQAEQRLRLDKAAAKLTADRGEAARLQGRLDSASSERTQVQSRVISIVAELTALEQDQTRAEASENDSASQEAAATTELRAKESGVEAARRAEAEAHQNLQKAQAGSRAAADAHRVAQARLETLEKLIRAGESYGVGLRKLLAAAEKGEVVGVGRPIAERLRVASGAEETVSRLLGPLLEAVTAESAADARRIAVWARAQNVAVSVIVATKPSGEAVEGWCDFLQPVPKLVHDRLRSVMRVANAFADETTPPAIDPQRGYHPERDLYVTGAPGSAAAESVFKLTRERDEAQLTLAKRADEELVARGRQSESEQLLEQALLERNRLRGELEMAQSRLAALRNARAEAEQAKARAVSAVKRLALDRDSAQARLQTLEQTITAATAELAVADKGIADGVAELALAQAAWSAVDNDVRTAGDAYTDARVRDAEAREQVKGIEARQAQHQSTAQMARTRLDRLVMEQEEIAQKRLAAERGISTERTDLERALGLAATEESRLAKLREAHTQLAAEVNDLEAAALDARRKAEAASLALREAEIAAERAKSDLEHTETNLVERFGLSPAAARQESLEGGMTPELHEELVKVIDQLDRLGPVNPAAEEEYAEALERQTFLAEQKADLEKAIGDLESAIKKMDKMSRELFDETFKVVDAEFQRIFPQLFRGGRARLELTDPENLLETGVDIIAQPPGKRFQNMNLLSGGEKALTAVSLIFAIFRMRPTPFCILDEVDAPLDEANESRFAEAVRQMSQLSQMLVITHKRRTMEAADTLYGVTMEEPGVSKVVGVRLGNTPA
jgi:chromosome segregation protein